MNITFNHNNSGKFELEFTPEEMKDLQYMLILSFNKLLDERIFCESLGSRGNNECIRRCESNLEWRDNIADIFDSVYGEEEDNG